MSRLSEEGQRIVAEVAARQGFSTDAVTHMLIALANGGGTQAQFNHFEFGGMGQWSMGGMTMVGDMFNHGLKARVDGICQDLAAQMQSASVFQPMRPMASQSQSQGGYQGQSQGFGGMGGGSSLFVPQAPLWPEELGQPGSQGAQNDMRYAYFPDRRRLAISVGGKVTVYDTGDHQIGGFGQSQSGDQSLNFNSQFGLIRVADLPVVTAGAPQKAAPAELPTPVSQDQAPAPARVPPPPGDGGDEQIFARLERLADFRERGILSDEEFAAKKAELLARL